MIARHTLNLGGLKVYEAVKLDQIYSEEQVNQTIASLAEALNEEYRGQRVVVCPVMTGAIVFAGKIIPQLSFEMQVQPIYVSRYSGQKGGILRQAQNMPEVIDQEVLLLDEILDEGVTMAFIKDSLFRPKNVKVAVLVEKLLSKPKPCIADFYGMNVQEGQYVVGSGMDYNGWCRNLPGIWEVVC